VATRPLGILRTVAQIFSYIGETVLASPFPFAGVRYPSDTAVSGAKFMASIACPSHTVDPRDESVL